MSSTLKKTWFGVIGFLVGAVVKGPLYFVWGIVIALCTGLIVSIIQGYVRSAQPQFFADFLSPTGPLALIGLSAFTVLGLLIGAVQGVWYGLEAARERKFPLTYVASKCFWRFFQI